MFFVGDPAALDFRATTLDPRLRGDDDFSGNIRALSIPGSMKRDPGYVQRVKKFTSQLASFPYGGSNSFTPLKRDWYITGIALLKVKKPAWP